MKWFQPSEFDWEEPPPLSSFQSVTKGSVYYVLFVFFSTHLSRKLMPASSTEKNGTTGLQWIPWFKSDLKTAQFVHNVVLVLSSAMMFLGVFVECIKRLNAENSFAKLPNFLFCEESDAKAAGPLYYWSYIYYLSKYYELLDTVLQLARGKPPPHFFLHVYHHAAVLFMAWAWVETKQTLHFIGLMFNTAVHVVMYSYFLQRTITRKVPRWKSFVTLFQIIQFSFSLLAFFITCYFVHIKNYECSGMSALYGNVIFNVTLLHSFVGVFLKGKKQKKK